MAILAITLFYTAISGERTREKKMIAHHITCSYKKWTSRDNYGCQWNRWGPNNRMPLNDLDVHFEHWICWLDVNHIHLWQIQNLWYLQDMVMHKKCIFFLIFIRVWHANCQRYMFTMFKVLSTTFFFKRW